jgi:hypothetical protein
MKSKSIKFLKKEKATNDVAGKDDAIEVKDLQRSSRSTVRMNLRTKQSTKKPYKYGMPILFTSVLILVIGAAAFLYFVLIPAQRIMGHVDQIQLTANAFFLDFNKKDISNIDIYFENIQTNLNAIDSEISQFDFLKNSEQTKGYYDNFQKGRVILGKTDTLLEKSLPKLKNVLKATGFRVDPSEPIVSAPVVAEGEEDEESTINLILKELPLYLNLYEEIQPDLEDIMKDVKTIDPNYVPNVGGFNIRDKLISANELIDEYPELSDQTVSFLKNVPELIGSDKETRYLIILQNEAEMRASGGLITAFGDVTIKNGEFEGGVTLQDSWNLQLYLWELGVAMPHWNMYGQLYLMNYGCGATEARAQDVAQYPDLYESSMLFKDYYDIANEYNPEAFPSYDHIVFINLKFAENILGLVQPLQVEPFGEVTADNLFQFIKAETDDPKYHGFNKDRKQILQDIADAIKKKLFDLPINEMPRVLKTVIGSFQAKDIALSTKNSEMQAFFDNYGLSAKTAKNLTGDYFQLGEAQNCALKLNKWVRNSVYQEVKINDNGNINRTIWVNWTQPKIYDNSLGGQYSDTTQFSYRAWVMAYMPRGVSSIESDGLKRSGYLYYYPQEGYDEVMDKDYSDNIIWFDHRRMTEEDPIDKQQLNINYNLPDSINYLSQNGYSLVLQKHPGKSWGEQHEVVIMHNGQRYSVKVTLDRDKIITYKAGVITVDDYDKRLDWINNIVDRIPWDKIKTD